MRIITHGDLQELGQIYCSKCHCLFGYNSDDLHIHKYNSNSLLPISNRFRWAVTCPECGEIYEVCRND